MPLGTRLGTGLALLVAGGTHLWSWSHGYRHTSVGPAFLVDTFLSAVVGVLVLVRANRVAAWAGSAVSATALLAYGIARTVGLFGFVERTWTTASLLAAGCEATVLVLLLTEALLPTDPVT
jgi:prolipoprotein diacylglyceryltransferase